MLMVIWEKKIYRIPVSSTSFLKKFKKTYGLKGLQNVQHDQSDEDGPGSEHGFNDAVY